MKKQQLIKPRLEIEEVNAKVTPLSGRAFIYKVQEMLGKAQNEVCVVQFQWRWYPQHPEYPLQQLNMGIYNQIKAGRKYRIIINSSRSSKNLSAINNRAERYLTEAGAKVKRGSNNIITHAKIFIIDDKYIILGSHNLSHSATMFNDEVSILIENNEIVREYKRYFETIWNRT